MSSLEKLHSLPLSKSFISIFRILYFNYESLKYVLEGLIFYLKENTLVSSVGEKESKCPFWPYTFDAIDKTVQVLGLAIDTQSDRRFDSERKYFLELSFEERKNNVN